MTCVDSLARSPPVPCRSARWEGEAVRGRRDACQVSRPRIPAPLASGTQHLRSWLVTSGHRRCPTPASHRPIPSADPPWPLPRAAQRVRCPDRSPRGAGCGNPGRPPYGAEGAGNAVRRTSGEGDRWRPSTDDPDWCLADSQSSTRPAACDLPPPPARVVVCPARPGPRNLRPPASPRRSADLPLSISR
jgi:hypothetical protein